MLHLKWKQLISRNQREMSAYKLNILFYFVLFIIFSNDDVVGSNTSFPRRFGDINSNNDGLTKDVTTQPVDQDESIAHKPDENIGQRLERVYSDSADYAFNNVDINLIHSENKPLHTKITAKYKSSISIPTDNLENAQTAEEYVSKAVGLFGSRIHEPIYIPELSARLNIPYQVAAQNSKIQEQQSETAQHVNNYQYYIVNNMEDQEVQLRQEVLQNEKLQVQQEQKQTEGASAKVEVKDNQLFKTKNTEVLNNLSKDIQVNNMMETQLQGQQDEHTSEGYVFPAIMHTFEKDAPPNYFNPTNYDHNYGTINERINNQGKPPVDRIYHAKYAYTAPHRPSITPLNNDKSLPENESEEKIRSPVTTEIPKEEILKQIERSVIKYMKELEAEGKIITPLGVHDTKSTLNSSEIDKSTKTSSQPFLTASLKNYQHESAYPVKKTTFKHAYSGQQLTDVFTPNVEFVYKIKTRAPLQAATVKTISKPYTLTVVPNYDQFSFTPTSKNNEELGHSLMIVPPNNEAYEQRNTVTSPSKVNKQFFNSETDQEINSVPVKTTSKIEREYKKINPIETQMKDYIGYAANTYILEAPSSDFEKTLTNVKDNFLITPYQQMGKNAKKPNSSLSPIRKNSDYENYTQKNIVNQDLHNYYQNVFKSLTPSRHNLEKRGKRGDSNNISSKNTKVRNVLNKETSLSLRPST